MDKKKFGNFIREKRTERGLTQKELADGLYLDVTAISKWERGISYPDITLIPDICRILEVSEHELIESSKDTEYRKMKEKANKYQRLQDSITFLSVLLYGVAVLVCFIVNLAVEKRLSWFFIVLVSCVCGYAFLPGFWRYFERYRFSIFLGSSFLSLFFVFLVCSLYTKNYWFGIATLGTLLGYFVFFYPVVFTKQKSYLKNFRLVSKFFPLSYVIGILVLILSLLITIDAYAPFDLSLANLITLYSISIFFACGLVALLPWNRLIRLGMDFLLSVPYLIGLSYVLPALLGEPREDYSVNFADWERHANGNTCLIILLCFALLGIALMILGFSAAKKKKKSAKKD